MQRVYLKLIPIKLLLLATIVFLSKETLADSTEHVEDTRLSEIQSDSSQLNASIGQRLRTGRLSIIDGESTNERNRPLNDATSRRSKNISAKKHEEPLSTDCSAKQTEVLYRRSHPTLAPSRPTQSTINTPTGFQRLTPKLVDSSLASVAGSSLLFNESSLTGNFDGEHVPRCKQDGSYEPVQCHKIGYCWCVNKYGQAIKNSAVMSGEEPFCDPSMYESDSNDLLVVAGISAQRMKNLLKSSERPVSVTTPNGHINFEATEATPSEFFNSDSNQHIESGKANGSREPTMPLIPNDCKSSRFNARERAMKHANDSIWVPECDSEDEKLYAERQCHRSRVCWCVDQSSGLPLKTSEQLSVRVTHSNCTELRRILELTSIVTKPTASRPSELAFFQGSSEFCDTDKRTDFVITLNNQFRQQISEYLRQNPTSPVPKGMSSSNPFLISDIQVSKWKFNIMDRDLDGQLGDREWSKFKNNFKLVDKTDELENPSKQQKSPYFSLAPLLLLRSQRKCWRDFLDFCGSGDLLVDESISLSEWLICTRMPPKSAAHDDHQVKHQTSANIENTYAHSREAAMVRSKKKNPFLGILKPD